MSTLSLVIPCYNEAKNIPLLLERVSRLHERMPDAEVILVDNGSTDDTWKVFAEAVRAKERPGLKTVRVEKNQGYGFGILSGLKEARGAFLAWTHADMQTDLLDAVRAYEQAMKSPDPSALMIKGNRKKRNPFDAFFTFGMAVLSFFALKTWLSDINAQPKLFSRKLYGLFHALWSAID